ncbi:diaminopimelate decarboxylase [Nodularia spumigena]|jgi:diaminopimelate decarboxylase|uniref:Diaminopimelate decarboxylase n=2 Tax=Nodularia spumigena TaxID=70799 RepID=A0A166KS76_NODSP|nr:diaminopimelate decarboxylase [Nodularia spumigena]KZL51488.1 diaminopimelate decarboxylase [Nodularia spumigena CENA596]MEA5527058.1 diaminopimelate decarboxylase [Nodularia spumigena UHCC 0143]MEA5555536.1 diaminopimelate decarboxylase [Nodularia spumigena CH309]MEA5610627.1 diaminopimelate decarboxylase [Nodularia spumigena UHCC 0060]MEA5615618.1 diaminopimelate decarboxylase [Nodularia spumigena UHCC 0040]
MVSTHPTEVQHTGTQYLPQKRSQNANVSPNQELLPLTAKVNSQDILEIGGCDVTTLVEQFGSPLYILDEETLRLACQQYRDTFKQYYQGESQVLYASKAWNCLAICAIAASEGLGIDVVSGGELYTALNAGVTPDKLYLHGNNKSREELVLAIESGSTIVADNWQELRILVEMAEAAPGTSAIRIMLRLTPGIECHTHEYIRTGHLDSKFGFDPNDLDEVFTFVSKQPSLNCVGLHAHIGSQIFERQPHRDLAAVMVQWLQKAANYGLNVTELNVGGGLGIRYTESDDPPSIEEWVKAICEVVQSACTAANLPLPKLLCEPGRSLIATACITAYTMGSSKVVPDIRTYVTVDGGMSDNPRPITYQSVYRAVVANKVSAPLTQTVTIAGKHCESGDILIKNAQLPKTEPGDILVIMGTGAYNYSMASNYNRLPRPAAVVVANGEANLILRRESYQDLIRQDCLPDRLNVQQVIS